MEAETVLTAKRILGAGDFPCLPLAGRAVSRHGTNVIELFPTEPKVLSVSELTRTIRSLLEDAIGQTWVEGEISNLRRQSSGHQYFTLKDDRSQLSCVQFRNSAGSRLGVPLDDGMQVQVYGDLTVYEARGQYQMVVQLVQPRGVGALQARFEALKRQLQAEGLFDAARKQPLPRFPRTIGLVTSPSAAALQDMLNILARRAPWMRVVVNPVRVQGAGAAAEIVRALGEFNKWALADDASPDTAKRVDVVVLARGGGSIEDLWEFNEEIVARAVAASALPVVSAVGHEIDFTIADFAADVRAPTPSAAAELIAPDTGELLRQLGAASQFFNRRLLDVIVAARDRLQGFARGTLQREPQRRMLDERQRLDSMEEALQRAGASALQHFKARLEEKSCCLRVGDFRRSLALRSQLLHSWQEKLSTLLCCEQGKLTARLHAAQSLLRVLGPQGTLDRGYSITLNEHGEIIRHVAMAVAGKRIVTRLSDGRLTSILD